MTFPEWSLIVCSVLSVSLTICPWMVKVHAKLAVIASKMVDLGEKMDRTCEENRRLWITSSRHQSRLDTHDVQLSHIAERLRGE